MLRVKIASLPITIRTSGKFEIFQKLIIRQSEEGFYALLSWSFKPPRFWEPWRFLWCCRFIG
ncbi:MAG: hypothetical protein GDA51_11630 [Ekhidna sp.]|nr:hypothetical protein [Ekhidna sp.]